MEAATTVTRQYSETLEILPDESRSQIDAADSLGAPSPLAPDLALQALDRFVDAIVITRAVRNESGEIVHFAQAYANDVAASHSSLLDSADHFRDWVSVVESGEPLVATNVRYDTRVNGKRVRGWFEVQTTKLGDGCLHVWHDMTRRYRLDKELRLSKAQLDEAQRLAHVGTWRFDIDTARISGSNELFEILGLEGGTRSFTLDAASMILPLEDRNSVRRARRGLMDRRRPFSLEQRIRRVDGHERIVLVNCDPVLDSHGMPTAFEGTIRDITEQRIAAHELARKDAALRRQAFELRLEHDALNALQETVLPDALSTIPGILLGADSRAANDNVQLQVGGDWYDAFVVDEQLIIVLGDVTGHGLEATRVMSQLRDAARAYARLRLSPAQVLDECNRFLLEFSPGHTATAAIFSMTPATGAVTWAQAGHLPPFVASATAVRYLDRPEGVLLGAADDVTFGECEFVLDQRAALVCFSDGLVETRAIDLDTTMQQLLGTVAATTALEPQELCSVLVESTMRTRATPDDISVIAVQRVL